jgi:hypothetical protein
MDTGEIVEAPDEDGLRTVEAEFYTQNFVVRGRVASPETRLSDHLNSAASTFELLASRVLRSVGGLRVNMATGSTYVAKSHLLFALPVADAHGQWPARNEFWTHTLGQTCWAGVDRYSLLGTLHVDARGDPRLFLRSLEQRHFLPMTNVRLTFPDGSVREYPAVIVNRHHVELLALHRDDSAGAGHWESRVTFPHTEHTAL